MVQNARMAVCYTNVQTLIRKLEFGKSAGPDGICAEALKCAHDQLSVLLSLLVYRLGYFTVHPLPTRLQMDQNFLTQKIVADPKMRCHQ